MNKKGFTIVETLIAISFFSSLLLLITYAYIFTMNSYAKGYNISKSSETIRSAEQIISDAININSINNSVFSIQPIVDSNSNVSIYGYCAGNYRFSYIINQSMGSIVSYNNHSTNVNDILVEDVLTGCNPLSSAQDILSTNLTATSKELMTSNLILGQFDITNSGKNGLYNLALFFGYGNTQVANGYPTSRNIQNLSPTVYNYMCPDTSSGGQTCNYGSFIKTAGFGVN